jgi:hypothetical protein
VVLPACPACLIEQLSVCACGGAGDEPLLTLDDEEVDVSVEEVRAAIAVMVPKLTQAALARAQRIDLAAIPNDFDPMASPLDAAQLADALRLLIPQLLRREIDRLRGRMPDL